MSPITEEGAASPLLPLLGGSMMPQMGLGTWSMNPREARETVARAIGLGYRLIDTAEMYDNEEGVGLGLRDAGVARDELFVTTKLPGAGHGVVESRDSLQRSLARLALEYVDLYLIHWPLPAQDRYVDAWRGLVGLREEGLAKAIGVSNFKTAHIDRIVAETGVTPEVNQIQLNPFVTRDGHRAYDADRGIITQSWSPLGKGVHALLRGTDAGALEESPVVAAARDHGKTPAQIVLRWHIELGLSAVPKSTDAARLASNIDVFNFELTRDQRDAISALDQGEEVAADADGAAVGG